MEHPNFSDKGTPVKPPKLLDQVRDKLRVKHYSIRTEKSYLDWIKRYILFHDKSHRQNLGAPDVEAFLTHLAIAGKGGGFYLEPDQVGLRTPGFSADVHGPPDLSG